MSTAGAVTVLGRTLYCYKKKSREPYEVVLNGQHLQVLLHLLRFGPASDYQIVHAHNRGSHQLGARRCELRDAGLVEQDGTCKSGMTWRLTIKGADLMDEAVRV